LEEVSRSGLKVSIFNSWIYVCHTIKRDASLSLRQVKVLKLTHTRKALECERARAGFVLLQKKTGGRVSGLARLAFTQQLDYFEKQVRPSCYDRFETTSF
jgi:hypothetical protein